MYMDTIVVYLLYYMLICINVCWNRLRKRLKLYSYVFIYEKTYIIRFIRYIKIFYYLEIENDFLKL